MFIFVIPLEFSEYVFVLSNAAVVLFNIWHVLYSYAVLKLLVEAWRVSVDSEIHRSVLLICLDTDVNLSFMFSMFFCSVKVRLSIALTLDCVHCFISLTSRVRQLISFFITKGTFLHTENIQTPKGSLSLIPTKTS